MHDEIATLFDIQELDLVITESRILHDEGDGAQEDVNELRQQIDGLRKRVSAPRLQRYDMLRRNGLAVTEEHDGVCNGCRLSIPVGDLNRMRTGAEDCVCPNCSRFIVLSDPNCTG